FNSRRRSDIARSVFDQALRDRVGNMWRMFHWAYSSTSALLYYGIDGRLVSTLQSAEGVRQGDPLAALSFALSVHSLFVNALRDTGAKGVAVLDDLSIIGPFQGAARAFDGARQQFERAGLRLQLN